MVGNTCIRQAGMHIDDQFIMVISVDKVAATIDAQCRQLSHLDVYSSQECIVLVPKQRAQSLSELEMPCIDHVFAMSDNRQQLQKTISLPIPSPGRPNETTNLPPLSPQFEDNPTNPNSPAITKMQYHKPYSTS